MYVYVQKEKIYLRGKTPTTGWGKTPMRVEFYATVLSIGTL